MAPALFGWKGQAIESAPAALAPASQEDSLQLCVSFPLVAFAVVLADVLPVAVALPASLPALAVSQ
jgi:hypothetical protein